LFVLIPVYRPGGDLPSGLSHFNPLAFYV
jgi:hypothetical protein